nr:putative occlusion-derived virus envelope protein [Culex nigripalpus nucleopolyhedrovirus]
MRPDEPTMPMREFDTGLRRGDQQVLNRLRMTSSERAGLNNIRGNSLPDNLYQAVRADEAAIRVRDPNLANARTEQEITDALARHPRLRDRLTAGGVIKGAGVSLVIVGGALLAAELYQYLNRMGGAFIEQREADGSVVRHYLLWRSCGMDPSVVSLEEVFPGESGDPIYDSVGEAQAICSGYNKSVERSVCRQADVLAEPSSQQFLDARTLPENAHIYCVEPGTLGRLVADLGLADLVDAVGGSVSGSSGNSSGKSSGNPLILISAFVVLIIIIFVVVFGYSRTRRNSDADRTI